jgi:hypothetical protein
MNNLIKKNNILTIFNTIDDRLYDLMKAEMNSDEQKQFVENFILYLQYGDDDTKFIINFDEVWKWVGFSRKDHAKHLLVKKFTENINFIYQKDLPNIREPIKKGDNEIILLNVITFKKFCMIASTKRADDICNYYLKMEKIMHQYTKDILIETQKKLNNFIDYDEELFWNENQINDYNNKNVIYVAFIGLINNERIYKYGKSEQIYTREFKQHKKFFDLFKMRFVIECDNMSFVEKEFKKFLKSIDLLKNIEIKESNITELFTIKEKQNIDYIIENLIKLVDENPLQAVKLLQDKIKEKDDEILKYKILNENLNKELENLKEELANSKEKNKENEENNQIEINEIIEEIEENEENEENEINEENEENLCKCPKCKKKKILNENNFKLKADKVTFFKYCIECLKKMNSKEKDRKKLYYEKNKERIKDRKKLYYEKNKEKINEKNKLYHENNKEKINNKKKIYHENNKERRNEKDRLNYWNKKERLNEK